MIYAVTEYSDLADNLIESVFLLFFSVCSTSLTLFVGAPPLVVVVVYISIAFDPLE